VLYALTTLSSMFTVTAAVSIVTAGLFAQLLGWEGSFGMLTIGIFVLCFAWLALGKYKFLDRSIKVIIGILFLSTVAAFITTALNTGLHPEWSSAPNWSEITDVTFTLALVGWMPTAVDLSVWNSIWTVNKMKGRDVGSNLKEVLREFHLGYWLSAVSALLFLGIGTMLMFNSPEELPAGAVGFAGALVELYGIALGSQFKTIIVIAASAAMFSTTLSVFDGYGRTTRRLVRALSPRIHFPYWLAVGIVALGGWFLVVTYQQRMRELVDLAMLISLVIAPVIAVLNHKLVHSVDFPITHRPSTGMTIWSFVGIAALALLSGAYLMY
ncbi:MAG: hypothetical protein HWE14_01505, partial [Flavobacteriia bacterium]|nr:hypothetical protein [Flavobacteriia bacterium]